MTLIYIFETERLFIMNEPYANVLINPSEQVLATLGTGFLANVVTGGGIRSSSGLVTNKRVYLSGKCLTKMGKSPIAQWEEHVVDLKDITGTGFEVSLHPLRLIIAICIYLFGIGVFFMPLNRRCFISEFSL